MQSLAAIDLQGIIDWVLGHIGPIFIAVVFFVIPILRGIAEQAKKKKQLEQQQGGARPEHDEEADAGRKAWEALLRGEEPTTKLPPPLVVPPVVRSAPPPLERSYEGTEVQPTLTRGPLSDLSQAPTENEEESTLDEEGLARELNDRLLREEMQRRADFLSRERENAARKEVAPESLVSIEARELEKSVVVDRTALTSLFGGGSDRRAALRRAIIAREVLGPPLALRTHVDALGPTALSP